MKNLLSKFVFMLCILCFSSIALEAEKVDGPLISLLKSDSHPSNLVEAVVELVENGADVNESDADEKTVLMYAVKSSSDLALKLVELGADVNLGNHLDRTALFFAAEEGNVETFKMLVSYGADIHKQDTYSFGVLNWAAKYGNVPILEYLLSEGAVIDEPSGYRYQTPLMAAAEGGSLEAVKFLLSEGAQIDFANETGQTALMGARNPEVVRLLVEKGAQVNRSNSLGFTPVVFAVLNGNPDALAELIALGANPNTTAMNSDPLLGMAIRYKNLELIKPLVEGGADLEEPINGLSPFVVAAKEGLIDMLVYFKEQGIDPKSNGEALLQASVNGHIDTIIWLLKEEVPVDHVVSRYQQTALYGAVSTNQTEVVQFLLTQGANPNASDRNGETALARATLLKSVEIIKLLKQFGAKE